MAGSRQAQSARAIRKRDIPASVEREVLDGAEGCHYCFDLLMPLQVEHVRPLSRGGTNDRANLVAACISCNSQKKTMLVHEWRQWRTSNGMPWPPIASHATEPRHYADRCWDCFLPSDDDPDHDWIVVPDELLLTREGDYVGHFHCPRGHRWKCWWSPDCGYFSDCYCGWCVVNRADNGERDYPASLFYADARGP